MPAECKLTGSWSAGQDKDRRFDRILTQLAYEVTLVRNGQEAVAHFQDHASEIDLVVLDMTMPVVNGRQCYGELKKSQPGVKVLLSTGHMFDEDSQQLLREGVRGIVRKPFKAAELSRAVAKALADQDA